MFQPEGLLQVYQQTCVMKYFVSAKNFGRFWLFPPTMYYWPSSQTQQTSCCLRTYATDFCNLATRHCA